MTFEWHFVKCILSSCLIQRDYSASETTNPCKKCSQALSFLIGTEDQLEYSKLTIDERVTVVSLRNQE